MLEGGVDKGGDRGQGDDFCLKSDPGGRIVDDGGVGQQERIPIGRISIGSLDTPMQP